MSRPADGGEVRDGRSSYSIWNAFVVGSLLLMESKDVRIWEDVGEAAPG
jgi:hypothetical protein